MPVVFSLIFGKFAEFLFTPVFKDVNPNFGILPPDYRPEHVYLYGGSFAINRL